MARVATYEPTNPTQLWGLSSFFFIRFSVDKMNNLCEEKIIKIDTRVVCEVLSTPIEASLIPEDHLVAFRTCVGTEQLYGWSVFCYSKDHINTRRSLSDGIT